LHLLFIEWVAVAIMMHDMGEIYWGEGLKQDDGIPENPFLRLSFARDPLSAIVTLADIIEDFERQTVTFHQVGSGETDKDKREVELDYKPACKEVAVNLDSSGVLTLSYRMPQPEEMPAKRGFSAKDSRKYFDQRYGYLDLSDLGIKEVRMTAEQTRGESASDEGVMQMSNTRVP